MTFEKLTFPLSNSKEKLRNLSDVAVFTLLINPPRPFWLICCAKLSLDLIDDLDLLRGYMYAYQSVLIFTIRSGNINDTLKKMAL